MNVLSKIVRRFPKAAHILCFCLALGGLDLARAAEPPSGGGRQLTPAAQARVAFLEARQRHTANPTNSEAAWQFARACFDLAEFAQNNSERAEIAERGIAVARPLAAREPNLAEAHYYLGMNLGQLARTKTLGALRLVDQMEETFLATRRLNEKLDYAGADRNLGLLYLEAPSFGSIGSRSKARIHLRRAVELAPDYPENRLNLAEAYARWDETEAAAREFKALVENWGRYRQQLSGERWASSWADWNSRFDKLRNKLGDAVTQLSAESGSRR